MQRILLALSFLSAFSFSPVNAGSNGFFSNLAGQWSGSGQAYLPKLGEVSADCRLSITGGAAQAAMNGSCGLLVFRQALGFTIRNSGGNRYVGTYTGSRTGPAKLDGTLQGNRLVMRITWGGLVNGDRTAQMVLMRTGSNSFAQTVIDSVAGKTRSTSAFNFKRS